MHLDRWLFCFVRKHSMAEPVVPSPVVIAVEEQKPVPMMQIAPDGVTPVPIASLGDAANTPPGSDTPVGQVTTGTQAAPQVATGTPVNMTVMAPQPVPATVTKGEGQTLAPQTTEQQDIVTAGQRRVSLLWESTQAAMAVLVTLAMIYTAIMQIESLVLTSAFFLIVGTYFNRTNSHLIGGVGPKATDNQPYRGR